MHRTLVFLTSGLMAISNAVLAEMAVIGEPLKKVYLYQSAGNVSAEFHQIGETTDTFSMICDMGQAIPIPERKAWYKIVENFVSWRPPIAQ